MKIKSAFPIAKYLVPPIIKLWIKRTSGLQNIPKGPFILAPNHCSYMEHFMIGSILVPYLNEKLFFIAKKEHFESISQSAWHDLWKKYITYIPIDRSKGEEAIKAAVKYLKKGAIIVIYPEGTRSLDGKIQKGKTGVARLALWARVPIVPLGIRGTFEILPKGKAIPRFKRATFNIGKPIYLKQYHNKKITKALLRKLTNKIMNEIAKLSYQEYEFK